MSDAEIVQADMNLGRKIILGATLIIILLLIVGLYFTIQSFLRDRTGERTSIEQIQTERLGLREERLAIAQERKGLANERIQVQGERVKLQEVALNLRSSFSTFEAKLGDIKKETNERIIQVRNLSDSALFDYFERLQPKGN